MLALVAAIAAVGLGSIWDLIPRFRMVQVTRSLQSDIASLRNMAIAQNRETRLLLVDADPNWSQVGGTSRGEWWLQVGNRQVGSNRWDTLPVDAIDDGVDNVASTGVIRITPGGRSEARGVSLVPWTSIVGPGSGNSDAIVFSPRGWVANPLSDFSSDGYIHLTLVNKAAFANGFEDSMTLYVAPSGMVFVESSLGGRI